MNFEWLWSHLLALLSSSLVTAIILLWFFVKNPEKLERWISIITRGLAWSGERWARVHMSTDIQSAIAEKRKKLGLEDKGLTYGVKVKWTDENTVLSDLQDNKVVVMMRPYKSQSKNFAHVVSVYVPKALLPRSKRYVDPNLMRSINCTISKSILEIDPLALEYYLSEVLGDVPEEVGVLMRKMDVIGRHGHLTRITIPELQRLSSLYPREPDSQVHRETVELVEEIHRFVVASERGASISGLGIYLGNNIKVAIVPVGVLVQLLVGGIQPHFDFIREKLADGIDHFYIVSTHVNIKFAKELVERVCEELNFARVFAEEHEGRFRGHLEKMFCSLVSFYHG